MKYLEQLQNIACFLSQSSKRIQCNVTIDWPENWLKKLFSNKNNNLIALYIVFHTKLHLSKQLLES